MSHTAESHDVEALWKPQLGQHKGFGIAAADLNHINQVCGLADAFGAAAATRWRSSSASFYEVAPAMCCRRSL
jgi:hypothetical protein